VIAQFLVGSWLSLWAVACVFLARRALAKDCAGVSALIFVPALALGLAASALLDPRAALAEGTAGVMLAAVAPADARTGYLFDSVTLPSAAVCSLIAILERGTVAAVCAAGAIVVPLALVALVSRGRYIGWGDVKACLSVAVAFGFVEAALVLFLASVSGLLVCGLRIHRGRSIPFGPHLASGAAAVILFGSSAHRILENVAR
jgi:prepilin signal peptidase PulO-like enzyme (type II secretory pathway)